MKTEIETPTLVVNLLGGPGTGKSTHAAGLFYRMKRSGINCEYIQEYAKDKTWEEEDNKLSVTKKCQPYVTGKQFWRQFRVMGKVDVVVTDSPIITGVMYQGFGCTPAWEQWAFEAFNMFNNLNIFLVRNTTGHPYNPKGRTQTEDQAVEIDTKTRDMLDSEKIPYHVVEVSQLEDGSWEDSGLDAILKLVRDKLAQDEINSVTEQAKQLSHSLGV